jgi:predicted metal-dependent phosphoesterase TrpH
LYIDLHVHTNRYSSCAAMSPQEMAAEALAVGLDAVVITEHNTIWSEDELADLQSEFPSLLILRGFEVSAAGRHDILVYGVSDTTGFTRGMPPEEAVALAHERDGIAILAHPFRYQEELAAEVLAAPFDLCETRSVNIDPYHHELGSTLARHYGVPEVYNSDGHHPVSLGSYYNKLHKSVSNMDELMDVLRRAAFTPMEQPERVRPALEDRVERIKIGIRRSIRMGITEPEAVWRRVGNARQRIYEMLPQVLAELEQAQAGG